jgi:hypothetical protein
MEGRYRFRFQEPRERLAVLIREYQEERLLLVATLSGRLQPLTDLRLFKALLGYPLLTLKVTVLIHWQALKIWVRGGRFYSRPAPPKQPVS